MSRTFTRLVALVAGAPLLAGITGCAAASAPAVPWTGDVAYAWTPGDTLRYRLFTETTVSAGMDRPSVRNLQARIALAFAGEGRASTWIEEARTEMPDENPPLRSRAGPEITGQPFVLGVGHLGIDSVLSAAPLPRGWPEVMTGVRSMFPRLPGGPLPAGRTWTAANSFDVSTDTIWAEPQTRRVRYRVVGDSTIRRAPVVVVEYEERRTREVRRRGPPPPPPPGRVRYMPPVLLTESATEQGRFYFDARSGRLVRLTRTIRVSRTRPPDTSAESATLTENHRQTLELVSATARAGR